MNMSLPLHKIARDCNLGGRDHYKRIVILALLLGIEHNHVRRRLFERQDFSLDEALATCRAMEAAWQEQSMTQRKKHFTP